MPAMAFLACALVKGAFTGKELADLVLLCILAMVNVFVLFESDNKGLWRFDNGDKKQRFVIAFFLCFLVTVLSGVTFPYLLPGLPVAAALVLWAGLPQGLSSYLLLITMHCFLCDADPVFFALYMTVGIAGTLLFAFLDEEFAFGVPMICSLAFQGVIDVAAFYTENGGITPVASVFAAAKLVVCFLLLTVALKLVRDKVIHKKSDKYSQINDPEFPLLIELKRKNARAYYHAVHTAHFCDKLSERIGADRALCKAGGYYHKIGKMRGDSNLKNALDIAQEYDFPQELRDLLMEYGSKNTTLRSKEAAIVLLSDAMVSSVMFLFEKNKDARLNFEQISRVVFDKQLESGVLDECLLTLEDFARIKECFSEEKLYYDFLR